MKVVLHLMQVLNILIILYPTIMFKRSNGDEYTKLVNLNRAADVNIKYDDVFTSS